MAAGAGLFSPNMDTGTVPCCFTAPLWRHDHTYSRPPALRSAPAATANGYYEL